MKASRKRGGFDEGKAGGAFGDDTEGRFCRFLGSVGYFFQREHTSPRVVFRMSVNYCEVCFGDLSFLKVLSHPARRKAVGGEDEDSRSRLIEAMKDVDFLSDLITKNFHCDKVTILWFV